MKEKITFNLIVNEAAKSGALLGIVSISYMFIVQLLSLYQGSSVLLHFLISILSFVLWGFKLWLCIWLMKEFMFKLVEKYDEVTNRDTFRYGMFIALFSAILFSAVNVANILLISPETIAESIDIVMEQYSTILDSNSMSAMENVSQNFGTITFFSNLIYCFLFGTVLSSILSKKIPQVDEFKDFTNNN